MNHVATMSGDDRADLFRETSGRVGLPSALIEKDFWACWTLKQLFCIDALQNNILFKGGTSLSKIFKAIHRFSEDLDLAINFEMLGFVGSRHPLAAPSRTKRQKLLDEMLVCCGDYVANDLLQLLAERFAAVLGRQGPWELKARQIDKSSVVIDFVYPPCLKTAELVGYVKPMVVLEPGTHAEFIPRGTFIVTSFAAEQFPRVFKEPGCQVEAITAERTFWEKATILHAEYHRPADKPMLSRHSRHYYDVAMLGQSPIKDRAFADRDLLDRVVRHKSEFFHSRWAHYDLAVPGSFRLVPPEARLPELQRDYEATKVMIFGEPPTFDTLLEHLGCMESEINQPG
jgi:hypothetical protein